MRVVIGVSGKLRGIIERRLLIADARKVVEAVVRTCLVCQATKARNGKPLGLLAPLPVPQDIFASIALDFLSMPRVEVEGRAFDSILVVMCRLSSFVVTVPTEKAGLTSQRLAWTALRQVDVPLRCAGTSSVGP
jgi:hypothetical protein